MNPLRLRCEVSLKLFHYTSSIAAESILLQGIRISGRPHPGPQFGKDFDAVSLTSSSSSNGHALRNGECLVGSRRDLFVKSYPQYADSECIQFSDVTEVRLTVQIADDDPKLVSWSEYCRRLDAPKHFKWAAEFAALFSPCFEAFTLAEQSFVARKVEQRVVKLKGDTWWFYEGNVPKERIIKIEDRIDRPGKTKSKPEVSISHIIDAHYRLDWFGLERFHVGCP